MNAPEHRQAERHRYGKGGRRVSRASRDLIHENATTVCDFCLAPAVATITHATRAPRDVCAVHIACGKEA